MEYFLNLDKVKIEKQYDYTQCIVDMDLDTILNLPISQGYSRITELLSNITTVKGYLLLDIQTNLNIEEIDLTILHMLVHITVEILTKDKPSDYRDYLTIPRSVEQQILGTVKDIVQLVNTKVELDGIQIRFIDKERENGFKFVERIS